MYTFMKEHVLKVHVLTSGAAAMVALYWVYMFSTTLDQSKLDALDSIRYLIMLAVVNAILSAVIGPRQLFVGAATSGATWFLFLTAAGSPLSIETEMFIILSMQTMNIANLLLPQDWHYK